MVFIMVQAITLHIYLNIHYLDVSHVIVCLINFVFLYFIWYSNSYSRMSTCRFLVDALCMLCMLDC